MICGNEQYSSGFKSGSLTLAEFCTSGHHDALGYRPTYTCLHECGALLTAEKRHSMPGPRADYYSHPPFRLVRDVFYLTNFQFPSRFLLSTKGSFYLCMQLGNPTGELRHMEVTDNTKSTKCCSHIRVTETPNDTKCGPNINAMTGRRQTLGRHRVTRQCQKYDAILVGYS